MRFKSGLDFDAGLDIPVRSDFGVSPAWFEDRALVPVGGETEFRQYLLNQKQLFRVLERIIEKRYLLASRQQYDLTKPNPDQAVWFHAGYKQACEDFHKLVPRPTGE